MTREEALAEIAAAITDERRANLTGANLAGANLTNADLAGANLAGANLAGANLTYANLTRANLTGANLTRANLTYANLTRANLTGADLAGADLAGADLMGADLMGADLRGADLRGADLTRAYLAGANLTGAYLMHANLQDASLARANLTRADLTGANLTGANLTNAYLGDAIMRDANLWNANLTNADLGGAELWGANLGDADLIGANLRGANMRGAVMRDTILTGAYLGGADLGGADLTRAYLTDADLIDADLADATGLDDLSGEPDAWPAGFTPSVIEATPARVYGKHTAAVLKLRRPETPRAARDFKRMYPMEFESLKSVTQGRDFTPETVERLRYAYESPVEWLLTTGRYESDAQRLCAEPNAVLKFNVRIDAEQYTEEQRDILSKLRETSKRSGHPVEKKPFFTIGWVRYCVDDAAKTWLIEEVQSDVQGVRKGLKDPAARRQLEDGGLPPERVDEAVALLHPYMEHFYEDALGVVFDLAQQKGYSVEMLEYEDKRSMGSPRQIYTDLPKSMGMRLGPGSTVLSGVQRTWKITPNKRRKTSRRAAPRAAQRKTSRRRS